jgi:hypothetical protein
VTTAFPVLAIRESTRMIEPTDCPVLRGPPSVNSLSAGTLDQSQVQVTHSANYDQSIVAVLNHKVLHGPCPVPMNLNSSVTAHEHKVTRRELLVAKVGSVAPHGQPLHSTEIAVRSIPDVAADKCQVGEKSSRTFRIVNSISRQSSSVTYHFPCRCPEDVSAKCSCKPNSRTRQTC